MQDTTCLNPPQPLRVFVKDAVRNGKPVRLSCIEIGAQSYCINGNLIKVARLENEWFADVDDPDSVIRALANAEIKPDIFTFWQRVPDSEPKHDYYMEWESLAVLQSRALTIGGTNRQRARLEI